MKNKIFDYSAEIKDPMWQKRRLEIMNRDNFTCQICGNNKETLHVHHTIYIPGRHIWEYDDYQLITLCESCHDKEHKEYSELIKDTIYDMKYSGLTNFEIYTFIMKFSVGFVDEFSDDIQSWKNFNETIYNSLVRLAKRQYDIAKEMYG